MSTRHSKEAVLWGICVCSQSGTILKSGDKVDLVWEAHLVRSINKIRNRLLDTRATLVFVLLRILLSH